MSKQKFMAFIHLNDETWLIDRDAYFLLCKLQQVELDDEEKLKMYKIALSWFADRNKALQLEDHLHHLVIEFKDALK